MHVDREIYVAADTDDKSIANHGIIVQADTVDGRRVFDPMADTWLALGMLQARSSM